jgi:hypothetical protein
VEVESHERTVAATTEVALLFVASVGRAWAHGEDTGTNAFGGRFYNPCTDELVSYRIRELCVDHIHYGDGWITLFKSATYLRLKYAVGLETGTEYKFISPPAPFVIHEMDPTDGPVVVTSTGMNLWVTEGPRTTCESGVTWT